MDDYVDIRELLKGIKLPKTGRVSLIYDIWEDDSWEYDMSEGYWPFAFCAGHDKAFDNRVKDSLMMLRYPELRKQRRRELEALKNAMQVIYA